MGNCMSATAVDISEDDKRRHKEAEKSLKEVRVIYPGNICASPEQITLRRRWCVLSGEAKVSIASQGALVIPSSETLAELCPLGITIGIWRFRKIYYPQGV
jgi:hypothetical protein